MRSNALRTNEDSPGLAIDLDSITAPPSWFRSERAQWAREALF